MLLFWWLQTFHEDNSCNKINVNYCSYNNENNVARQTKKVDMHNI